MSFSDRSSGVPGAKSDRLTGRLLLVGRSKELEALEELLEGAARPVGAVLIRGEGGAGKSRIAEELALRAQRRGWTIARGRAYPVELGIPYALFSDAFLPILREMDSETKAVLTRGGEAELRYLFPALGLGEGRSPAPSGLDPDEFRTRLLWNFAEFVKSYASRTPLLVVLDDLHWADASSLELLHFLVRQSAGHPVVVIGAYNDAERERSPALVQMERSLVSLGLARVTRVDPLTRAHVTDLVCRTFGVEADVVREFSAMLYGWTHGNPFFAEEILKSLVAAGRLSRHEGGWIGWDATDFGLPGSIRDAVITRLTHFSERAQNIADLAAVVGTRASHPLLASISGMPEGELLTALEELCGHHVLSERAEGGTVVYEFRHPLVRETLYQELGLQRARTLHGTVAVAMETYWGDASIEHADELAYHFARTDAAGLESKAVRYLGAAGRHALARHANREAADYLRAALERVTSGESPETTRARVLLSLDLARAYLRLGDYDVAMQLWSAGLAHAPFGTSEHAALRRSLGLAAFWRGRHDEALAHFEAGLASAQNAGDDAGTVHLRLVRSHCLQELGRGGEAQADMDAALPVAEKLASPELLARVHRSLALLHVWIGPPEAAERHAHRAIELAAATGDLSVEFWARWGLAVLWGMSGNTARMAEAIEDAKVLADRLRSPVLKLLTAEMSIELAYGRGEWDQGMTLGERSIALARSLNQTTLLPRLLVWTSSFYVGRGNYERAKALVDEACELAGMHRSDGPADVHMLVPAYIGLANYLVGVGDYHGAIAAARKGLVIAEGTGYTLWVVHRLLPILFEACLWADELDEAEELGKRMRRHSESMNHRLGIAWADAGDAILRWKRGDPVGGAKAMRAAAEALDEIPMIPYAVRVRRQLAGRLAETGDIDGALSELRRVHDILAQLGAERELEKARGQFRELGHRPPPRGSGEGMAGLTGRELEICRLVARRKSNKAIGKDLGISPRTVSTHLSNVFQKLDVESRAELSDFVREQGMIER